MDVTQHLANTPAVENKLHLVHKITMKLSESCVALKSSYEYMSK